MKQLVLDIALPASPDFDNFVVGRNAELVQQLRAIADGSSAQKSLYMWGEQGSGRTHLLKASVEACTFPALYIKGGEDVIEIDPRARLIAIDDVETVGDAAQIATFHLYNRLREEGGAFIASGSVAPNQLALRADLQTRLTWGLVYNITRLTDEEKIAALHHHAQQRGFELKTDVANYLLRHGKRDMPGLIAILNALDRYSLETKRPITLRLLGDLLQDPLASGSQ